MQITMSLKNNNNFFFIITEEYLNALRQMDEPRTNYYDAGQEYADNCLLALFETSYNMSTAIHPPYENLYSQDDILKSTFLSSIKNSISDVCEDDVLMINQSTMTPTYSGGTFALPNAFDLHFTSSADQVAFQLKGH